MLVAGEPATSEDGEEVEAEEEKRRENCARNNSRCQLSMLGG